MSLSRLQKYAFLIIPIFFLFYSAPSALDYIFFHADEKRYTDAVIHMMDKGELLTPYKADGETPRFKKPIVTYWLLMAGFKVFGISPFGARFFFWVAGALLVAVTYLMTNSLLKNRRVAELAAFVAAANPLVLMSASRTIPDILLVLFLTISAWGFLEIMVRKNPLKINYWMAYLGAALAFETKGLPAAAFAVVGILFLLLNTWKRVRIRKLIHLPSILISVVVALSWFVIMYVQYGNEFLGGFWADQVGDRVSSRVLQVVKNGSLGIFTLVLFFVPWVFVLFGGRKQLKATLSDIGNSEKAIFGFIASWVLLVVLMSASVFKFYDRYVLPCIPLLSIVLAYFIYQIKTGGRKLILAIFISLNILLVGISLLYGVFISHHPLLIFGVLVALLFNVLFFSGYFRKTSKDIQIANMLLLVYFSVHTFLYAFLMPVPARQLAESLHHAIKNETDEVFFYGHIGIPAKVRVQSHNELHIVSMDKVYVLPEKSGHVIAFKEEEKNKLNLEGYTLLPGSVELSGVPVEKFPVFMQKYIRKLKDQGTRYYIGVPK